MFVLGMWLGQGGKECIQNFGGNLLESQKGVGRMALR